MRVAAECISTLVLVLGDQLDARSAAFDGFDPDRDAVLMIEAPGEAAHVWSVKPRIAIFLSAMRHFRDELRARGIVVHYVALEDDGEPDSLPERLGRALARLQPRRLRLVEAGEWRVARDIEDVARATGVELQIDADRHFFCSRDEFEHWAGADREKHLVMEDFYRAMRLRHRVLLDADGWPEGGRWNYDAANRKGWPKAPASRAGPGLIAAPEAFAPDAITREVIALVERRFAEHPGSLADFAWPVCRADALRALDTFVAARLDRFGDFQDAMWTATPFGWHSLLSSSLNLHLLEPCEVVAAAEAAYRRGDASLTSTEGFVRQILGWREYMRGVYWRSMPGLAEANHLEATRPLPGWYWSGKTKMNCVRDVVGQTMRYGYAHHIQRLMVTGLFALLAGIDPKVVAGWYLAVYVDAVEWAELPNVAAMALFADGGRFTTKPYIASGAYIDRMSDHCRGCTYAPTERAQAASGKPLCPFTALYWDFVERHADLLRANRRIAVFVDQAERRSAQDRAATRVRAAEVLATLESL